VRRSECVPNSPWVQSHAADPSRNEARILPRRHTAFDTTTTSEQELAGSFVGSSQIVIDRLARLFAHLESDWPAGFLLSDRCAIRRVPTGSDVIDPDGDHVAAIQGTMQAVTSVIEGWIREYPDQWLWLHRRWR
jgi:hypothetical protein